MRTKPITRPLSRVAALTLSLAAVAGTSLHAQITNQQVDGYHEFNYGRVQDGVENWILAINVQEPAPRSEVKGDVTVRFTAPGMTWATAWCWQQPDDPKQVPPAAWGKDVELTPGGLKLGAKGEGSFVFPADKFPNGPVSVRIHANNEAGKKDLFELQLFNTGGVVWNQGIPKSGPPAAKGLKLVFEDDFEGPLSISNDGRGARYGAHKPGGGDFSGWQFSDVLGDGKPFGQKGTWLRIAARKDAESPKGRSGLIASVDQDFKGLWAKAPFYMECRFTAQSAIGTWPAFWTLAFAGKGVTDEIDIIEAYGGRGKGNPNHPGYSLVSHYWGQKGPDGKQRKAHSARPDIMELGGKSYWSTTFHTYAVHVGLEECVYYFDDIEVYRHPTNSIGRETPHTFLVNLAIGGISGWPTNLTRYGEGTDMWVDYIRVYAKEPVPESYRPNFDPVPDLTDAGIGLNFAVPNDATTALDADRSAGLQGSFQRSWNNLEGETGAASNLKNGAGKTVAGLRAEWSAGGAESKLVTGRNWGFQHAQEKLQLGVMMDEGSLKISGIPYKNYDVHVYFGAGEHGGVGSATISTEDNDAKVDPNSTYYYRIGWMSGEFVPSTSTTPDGVKPSNCATFKGNTARSIRVDWAGNVEGSKTGLTGIQIVERR